MKVLISERQYKLIREFYENEYLDVVQRVAKELNDKYFMKRNPGFNEIGFKEILFERFGEYFSNKSSKLKKLIDANFESTGNKILFCGILICKYIDKSNEWMVAYDFIPYPSQLSEALTKFFEILKKAFPKEWDKIQQKIDVSDYEHTPFTYAGELPKEEGEDDLKQKIYDWEYTKDLLERLLLKYIHMEQYVDEEAFKIITKHRIIEKMFNIMDDHMKRSGYKLFGMINRINLDSDLSKFIIAYKEYFKFIDNLEYSPYKVFIDLVEGMKNKTKFELKK